MKKNDGHILLVKSKTHPTVEIDTEASAAYVRFKKRKVAKTLRHPSKWPLVAIDLDENGDVIGVEFIGVKKYTIGYLLRQVPIKAPPAVLGKTEYVAPAAATA
jgi:uncharacterized protein YuzE